jgi:hypothetical protein
MTAPDPPYPPDIRSRGWRFELDVERIKRSDTWALAGAAMRPWCLMLWMAAWDESPISLPADDMLIAAKIGMPPEQFQQNRVVLLRGWEHCSDGRLYHEFITKLVLEMVAKRAAERSRVARWREGQRGLNGENVTRLLRVTDPLPTRDQRVSTAPTTHHPPPKERKSKAIRPAAPDLPPGFAAFWDAYPADHRRVDKGKCEALWRKEGFEPIAARILSHVAAMRATSSWREGYEPAPLRYLSNRRWEDGLPKTGSKGLAL